ncbi:MAG: hypothetical protein IPL10_20580 [Bacteroidetes bacterium]|nr:hypothetical protein [Bacteroidota bacterium]
MVYKDPGDLKKAQEYILRSIKYNEQLGNLMEEVAAYDNIWEYLLHAGRVGISSTVLENHWRYLQKKIIKRKWLLV